MNFNAVRSPKHSCIQIMLVAAMQAIPVKLYATKKLNSCRWFVYGLSASVLCKPWDLQQFMYEQQCANHAFAYLYKCHTTQSFSKILFLLASLGHVRNYGLPSLVETTLGSTVLVAFMLDCKDSRSFPYIVLHINSVRVIYGHPIVADDSLRTYGCIQLVRVFIHCWYALGPLHASQDN